MNSKRANLLMKGLVIGLSLIAVYSVVWANATLRKKSEVLVNLKLENELADDQQTSLAQTNRDLTKYTDLEKIAKSVVPQDKDQAQTVREIVKIANESSVTLSNITFPASTLGQAAPKATANTDGTTTPTTPKTAPVTQVKPVDGIPGVYVMEINVEQETTKPITYDKLIQFLTKLEQNRRTSQVISVTVKPNPGDRNKLTFSLVLNVYIKP